MFSVIRNLFRWAIFLAITGLDVALLVAVYVMATAERPPAPPIMVVAVLGVRG